MDIPDNFVMDIIAIGKKQSKENLQLELQNKEFPSNKTQLIEIVIEGKFRK